MTEQEIEKLREKLGSDYSVKRQNGAITVELVDIWNGVEFASHIFGDEVYRVSEIVGDKIWTTKGTWLPKIASKRSTESAYLEQLKAKAHELYGEIKDGDRFDRGDMEFEIQLGKISVSRADLGWDYYKDQDQLFFGDLCLYNKGKWAEKLKSRVSVEVEDWVSTTNAKFESFDFRVKMRVKPLRPFDPNESAVYLAKCLEDYLNKSQ